MGMQHMSWGQRSAGMWAVDLQRLHQSQGLLCLMILCAVCRHVNNKIMSNLPQQILVGTEWVLLFALNE